MQRRDFVHVDDVVGAIRVMAVSKRTGTWNVATGVSASIRELLHILEERYGPAVSTSFGPRRPGDIRNSILRIDRIRADLGWTPEIDLRKGIARILDAESQATRAFREAATSW
jgi:UDP-glucose 4-epimerase